jgi:hypothetical protein
MKRSTCIVVILTILTLTSQAGAQYNIGVIGGVNYANFRTNSMGTATDLSGRTVYAFGFVIDSPVGDQYILHIEPMFIQKGGIANEISPGMSLTLKSSFIEVPVLFKGEFGNTVKPYVLAGPVFGIRVGTDLEADIMGETFKGDIKDITKTFELGVGFGGGMSYNFGSGSVFVETRYTFGMTEQQKGGMFEIRSGDVVIREYLDKDNGSIKYKGLQVMMGLSFPFGSN